jgi:signal transduction histidine kinase
MFDVIMLSGRRRGRDIRGDIPRCNASGRLEKELIEHRNHLEEMVNERTRELEKASKKISKHKTELQSLSAQLIKTQETERSKISHELHDDTGQALTAVKIYLEFIRIYWLQKIDE